MWEKVKFRIVVAWAALAIITGFVVWVTIGDKSPLVEGGMMTIGMSVFILMLVLQFFDEGGKVAKTLISANDWLCRRCGTRFKKEGK